MIEAITFGFATGVFLSVGFGAVFFALIQDSVEYSYKAGFQIASGVVIGDFLLVLIANLGTSFLPNVPNFENYARYGAAILLIGMAIGQLVGKSENPQNQNFKLNRKIYFIGKGFLLNVLNPVNFVAWAITSAALKSQKYDFDQKIVFYVVAVGMIFICEAAVSVFAYKIKSKLSSNLILKFKYITSVIFVFIAIKMVLGIN